MKYVLVSLLLAWGFGFAPASAQLRTMNVATFEKTYPTGGDTLYLYNFWATWCKPCVEELPAFSALAEELKDRPFKIVLVSLDFEQEAKTRLPAFIQRKGIVLPVWFLTDAHRNYDWLERISADWSGSIPATMMLNPQRGLSEFKEQAFTFESLKAWTLPMLP